MFKKQNIESNFLLCESYEGNIQSTRIISLIPEASNSDNSFQKSNSSGKSENQQIYVCTFCQVFSFSISEITTHISSIHHNQLPANVEPEAFVSNLQALKGNVASNIKKVGRPRKDKEKSIEKTKPTLLVSEPVRRSDGLFWCEKCRRFFKKARQLNQHICFDNSESENSSDVSIYSEEDIEFKTYMDINPIPWTKRKKRKCSAFESMPEADVIVERCQSNIPQETSSDSNRHIFNWRHDPSYVPLFEDNNDKVDFEEHLKTIDYSFVDSMFKIVEKRSRNTNKQISGFVYFTQYSCSVCKKVMKSLSHIRLHCLTHTDLKPFTCPKCPYRSNSKGSLYVHMRNHTGNLFKCSKCDFKSAQRSHVLDHEATHATVPQICKLCKNTYKTLRSLINHIRKYHNNAGGKRLIKALCAKQKEHVTCGLCLRKFKSEDLLLKHKISIHNLNQIDDSPVSIEVNSENSNIDSGTPLNSSDTFTHQKVENHKSSESSDVITHASNADNSSNVSEPVSTNNLFKSSELSVCRTQVDESTQTISSDIHSENANGESIIGTSLNSCDLITNQELGVFGMTQVCNSLQVDSSQVSFDGASFINSAVSAKVQNNHELSQSHQISVSHISEAPDSRQIHSGVNSKNTDCIDNTMTNASYTSDIQYLAKTWPSLSVVISSKDLIDQSILDAYFQDRTSTNESLFPNTCDDIPQSDLLQTLNVEAVPHSPSLKDTLPMDMISECPEVFSTDFQNEFDLAESMSESAVAVKVKRCSELLQKKVSSKRDETKSAEIKLFEKCHRAPAYVCCVCSAIYICPATLKAHLKEHVNSTESSIIEEADEQLKSNTSKSVDDVCPILPDSSKTDSYSEEKLKELYSSSLDMMWYLPEKFGALEKLSFKKVKTSCKSFFWKNMYDIFFILRIRNA